MNSILKPWDLANCSHSQAFQGDYSLGTAMLAWIIWRLKWNPFLYRAANSTEVEKVSTIQEPFCVTCISATSPLCSRYHGDTLLPWWGGWVVSRSHWDNGLGQQMVIILHYTLGTRAYWLDWCHPTQPFGAFLGLPSSVHGLQKQSAALMVVRKWWWV